MNLSTPFIQEGLATTRSTPLLWSVLVLFMLAATVCGSSFAQVAAEDPGFDILAPELRAWLNTIDRPLRVGLEPTFIPYAFHDENFAASGIAGDQLDLLAQRLGVEFEVVPYASFAELLEAIGNKEIDILPFVVPEASRQLNMNFTRSVYFVIDRLFTRSSNTSVISLDDLNGLRVGVIGGYGGSAEAYLAQTGAILVAQINEAAAVQALATGEIDALVSSLGSVTLYAQEYGISSLRIAAELEIADPQDYATRKDWPELTQILNLGLASISEEEFQQIENRWVNVAGYDTTQLEAQIDTLVNVLFVIVGFSTLVLVWIYSLRRQVNVRTAALQSELNLRQEVEAEKSRLIAAIDQSAEFFLIVDENKTIQYANHAFLAINKIPLRKFCPVESIAAPEDKERLLNAIKELKTGHSWRGRIRFSSQIGAPVATSANITQTMNDDGRVSYIITGRDITVEEELETRLRQGEKISALGTLASGLAHDFNNLLVPILGLTDVIEANSATSEPVSAIRAAALRGQQLVQRILTFSRLNNESEFEVFNVSLELEESLTFLRSLVPSTIKIKSNVEEGLFINGSKAELQQILLNLGTNAADAMPNSVGTLSVTLDKFILEDSEGDFFSELSSGEYVRLVVSDDGEGMDSDQQDRMFDPYFTNKPVGKGTGLGLATVIGAVKSHGGGIKVNSVKFVGTTIEVFFPIADGNDIIAEREHPAVSGPASMQRVLVVDDDQLVLETVGQMLKHLGYDTTLCSDPAAALELFKNDPSFFSLVISDYTMPNMTGAQLLEAIAEVNDVPLKVLMTGKADHIDSLGIPSITKPFSLKALSMFLNGLT